MTEPSATKYDPLNVRGPPKPVVWQVGKLTAGQTASAISTVMSRLHNFKSVLADGILSPVPAAKPIAAAGGGPRLLFGAADLDAIRAKTNAAHLAAAFAVLNDTASVARASQRLVAVAAHALLAGAANDVLDAVAAETQAVIGDASARHASALAEDVAALAMAFDLSSSLWTGDRANDVRDYLKTSAVRLAALGGGIETDGTVFGADRLLGMPSGAADYRLAVMRAAAGMAALAVGDPADPVWRDVETAAARTVGRVLRHGVGDRGAGNGNNGFAEVVERVYPFVQAYRRARGVDLAARTGVEWTALMGAVTGGLCFNRGPAYASGAWLAAALPLARPEHQSGLAAFAVMHGCRPPDPVRALLAVANLPERVPEGAVVERLPRVARDHRMGVAALRGGWDSNRDFVVIHEMGGDNVLSAAARHNFSVFGLGREWVARARADAGDLGWPVHERQNVVVIHPPEPFEAQIVPTYPAHFTETWFRPDGSGSVGGHASIGGFLLGSEIPSLYTVKGRIPVENPDVKAWSDLRGCGSWRTVGVDYSGASGAEALLLVVDGVPYAAGPRSWELDLGDVKESEVTLGPADFVVRPAGAKASMKGTFLHPGNLVLRLVPASRGGGTRLSVWLNKPVPKTDGPSLEAVGGPDAPGRKGALDDFELDEKPAKKEVPPSVAAAEARDKAVKDLYYRIHDQISSISMGAGDRWRKAKVTTVVVLTVQTGEPPAVKLGAEKESLTLRVGGQTVWYTEYLVRFARRPGPAGEWIEDPPPIMLEPPPPDPRAKKADEAKPVFEEKEEERGGAEEAEPSEVKPAARKAGKK
jgi:hypothetical protein